MKKILSLFFALTMVLGANAITKPVMRQNAPQMAQAVKVDYADAARMSHVEGFSKGDWYLDVYQDNGSLHVRFDINTGSDTTIAGIHQVGTPYASLYFNGSQNYQNITSGSLNIERVGDTIVSYTSEGQEYQMALPLYSMKATNLKLSGQNSTFSIIGRIAVFSYDRQYQKDYEDDASKWLVILKDKVGEANTNTVDVHLTKNLFLDDSDLATDKFWGFGGTTEDGVYQAQIVLVNASSVAGSYKAEDIYMEDGFTFLKKNGSAISLKSGNGTVVGNANEGYTCDFFLTGTDGTTYHVYVGDDGSGEGGGEEEDPYGYDNENAFNATFAEYDTDMSRWSEEDPETKQPLHYLFVTAQASGNGASLLFVVPNLDPETMLPEGVYPVSTSSADNTMMSSDGYIAQYDYFCESYAYTLNNQNQLNQIWYIVSGTAVVTKTDGKLKIVVDGKNSLGQSVKITIGGGSGNGGNNGGDNGGNGGNDTPNAYANDANTPFNATFPTGGIYSTPAYGNGHFTTTLTASYNGATISLLFHIPSYTSQMPVPAGTYYINNTGAANTIYASAGYVNYKNEPSYAMQSGQYWYITSGTATVTPSVNGQPYIVVNGTNSNNQTVNIIVGQTPNALDETQTGTQMQKTVDANGQIIIIRNGIRYNLQGAVVE